MNRLTHLLKPENLDQFIGQSHIIGKEKALYKLICQNDIPHLFFYGKPGTGKTTLARIIAKKSGLEFYSLNATNLKVEELREIFKRHLNSLMKPLIFIDEIHRLSKTQQEVLLPVMENYEAVIMGASTENPFFTLTSAIRSRGFLFEFLPLQYNELQILLEKAISKLQIEITNDAKEYLLTSSSGDGRALLNLIDFCAKVSNSIDIDLVKELRHQSIADGTSSKQSHYDITSAMIKSLRGSDVDASLYYLGRLLDGGESVDFIGRRLVIFSSEDIGNANPNALNLAVSTMNAVNKIGNPEARIILAQCVVYLASSPKSNSSYKAVNKTLSYIKENIPLKIPKHIQDNHTGYKYPHDYGGYVQQNYLEKELDLYQSSQIGFEKTLDEWINKIKN